MISNKITTTIVHVIVLNVPSIFLNYSSITYYIFIVINSRQLFTHNSPGQSYCVVHVVGIHRK